jgi:hypothetical protein
LVLQLQERALQGIRVPAQFAFLIGDRLLFAPELPFALEMREFNTRLIKVLGLSCLHASNAGAKGLLVELERYQHRFPCRSGTPALFPLAS